jgi:type I restriction enzyme S subunit
MSDWQDLNIGSICIKIIDYRGKTPEKVLSGTKLITSKVIKNSRILDNANFEYIRDDKYEEVMRRGKPEFQDILLTTEAPLGEVALIKSDEKIAIAQRIILLRADQDKVIPDFLFYSLRGPIGYNRVQQKGTGTTVLGIKNPELKKVILPIPPLPTQQKIAKILSNHDDLIENNLKRIKLLEESARLIYEEWFLRFRIDGKKLEIDPESSLPFGWELVELGDFLKFKKGKKADEIFEEKKDNLIKLLLLSGLGSGEYAYVEKARHVIARRGDVLMTMDGARSSVVFYSEDGAVGSTMSLVETGKLPKSYLYHFFKSTYEWLEINNTGAAIPHANKSFINKMKIIHPGDEILTKWSKKMYHINDQVFNLKDQNQLLKEARDILLPRLMTGMIDTDELDIAV